MRKRKVGEVRENEEAEVGKVKENEGRTRRENYRWNIRGGKGK